ncbi:MAG: CocE/NonD family hydrolase [Acidobacteriota bacterium]
MQRPQLPSVVVATVAFALTCAGAASGAQTAGGSDPKISRFGEYRGYSAARYEAYARSSVCIPVRDGIELAADILRPMGADGAPVTEPLPVIWTLQRYHRARLRKGRVLTLVETRYPWLAEVIRHGYVAVVVDARGTGASQGLRRAEMGTGDARDGYDVTEWLADRPWSSAAVGMFGRSFRGMTQYLVAGERPPSLRAIFPEMAMFDVYDTAYLGGIPRPLTRVWGDRVAQLDAVAGLPVDEDPAGKKLAAWLPKRQQNLHLGRFARAVPARDGRDAATGLGWRDVSPSRAVGRFRGSGIGVYHLGGWLDGWPADTLAWWAALMGEQQKMVIGPWEHNGRGHLDLAAEHLRWYDFWLKGIDNGVLGEAPIHYAVSSQEGSVAWKAVESWPPARLENQTWRLAAGASGTADSANDGRLVAPQEPAPGGGEGDDALRFDPAATSGKGSRWHRVAGGRFDYGDLSANDAKGLTYTSEPLPADLVVTGRPTAYLAVSASAADADLFVYLEEVDAAGRSHYVTEGALRASSSGHRLDGEPVLLAIPLLPSARRFAAGHRLRLTLTGAAADNAEPLPQPPPTIRIRRAKSWLDLTVEESR